MTFEPEPLTFKPLLKKRAWGGRSLGESDGEPYGESWELADLPDSIPGGRSIIARGQWEGRSLDQLLTEHAPMVMGKVPLLDGGRFPLLIKFLDAMENLSVQVHPDTAYADAHPDAFLKTEAWVVMSAEPGARLYRGIDPSITPEQFKNDILADDVTSDLLSFQARPGDCIYLPSGTCHALGGGMLVAEVQTPSDTTFRVYDWGRNQADRPLHIDQAMECIHFGPEPVDAPPPLVNADNAPRITADGVTTLVLARNEYFTIERIMVDEDRVIDVHPNQGPIVWMLLDGQCTMHWNDDQLQLQRRQTVLWPASLNNGSIRMGPQTGLLRVTPAGGLDSLMAESDDRST